MNDEPRAPRSNRRLWLIAAAALVIAVVAIALVVGPRLREPIGGAPEQETAATPDESTGAVLSGEQPAVLSFPNEDGSGWVKEERQLPPADRLEDSLRAVMEALCAGPTASGSVQVIPRGTRPLAVFYDEKTAAVVLDFSQEIVANHPGGTDAERATIDAILRTVALNFPQVHSCQLLVGGEQVETLAGHVALDRPFDPRRSL